MPGIPLPPYTRPRRGARAIGHGASDRGGAVQVWQLGRLRRFVQAGLRVGGRHYHRDGDALGVVVHVIDEVRRALLASVLLPRLLDDPLHGLLRVDRADLGGRLEHDLGGAPHLPVYLRPVVPGVRRAVPVLLALGIAGLAHRPLARSRTILAPQVTKHAMAVDSVLEIPRRAHGRALVLVRLGARVEVVDEGVLEGVLLPLELAGAVAEGLHALPELQVPHELVVVEVLREVDQVVALVLLELVLLLLRHGPEWLRHRRFLGLVLGLRLSRGVPLVHHLADLVALALEDGLHLLLSFLVVLFVVLGLLALAPHLPLQVLQPLHVLSQSGTGTAGLHRGLVVPDRRQAELLPDRG
mmetsp:Transcript_26182/g.73999  ORF Transcript_26182/g.73999 Transcript_26182/m.73999 type:complete len:355 (-) Transcript_26182:243-1307(-)